MSRKSGNNFTIKKERQRERKRYLEEDEKMVQRGGEKYRFLVKFPVLKSIQSANVHLNKYDKRRQQEVV